MLQNVILQLEPLLLLEKASSNQWAIRAKLITSYIVSYVLQNYNVPAVTCASISNVLLNRAELKLELCT